MSSLIEGVQALAHMLNGLVGSVFQLFPHVYSKNKKCGGTAVGSALIKYLYDRILYVLVKSTFSMHFGFVKECGYDRCLC